MIVKKSANVRMLWTLHAKKLEELSRRCTELSLIIRVDADVDINPADTLSFARECDNLTEELTVEINRLVMTIRRSVQHLHGAIINPTEEFNL
jgi:hypothetical protein